MVLNTCLELLIRTSASLLKFFISNWFMVIIALGITTLIIKRVGPVIIGLLAFLIDFASDSLFGLSFGLSTPISITMGIVVGFLWASLILFSPVMPIIKILNMFFMFLIGLFWGFFPVPFPVPVALILGFLMRYKTVNYIISIAPSLLVIGFIFLLGPIYTNICSGINWIAF